VDPISVPAPSRSAYHPNRRVSDLLLSQIKHFQHVEMKRGDLGIDPGIARNIHTEGGAAKYIAAVTMALRSKAAFPAAPLKPTIFSTSKPAKKASISPPLSIAAAADEKTSAAPKKTPAKKATTKKPPAKPTPKPAAKSRKQ